jgi:hemoglobin
MDDNTRLTDTNMIVPDVRIAVLQDVRIRFVDEQDVYAAIGEDGFMRLISAFYRRVREDDLLGPLYPQNDFAGAEVRLRDFLIYRFGGPARYLEQRGHPRLRMRHGPFPVDQAARDRWMQLMGNAMEEISLPEDAKQILHTYFESTATAMMNRI